MKIVISSAHSKYVSGAIGLINEVTESRRVVSRVTQLLKSAGVGVVEFHDDVSRNQTDNINNIVRFHNAQTRDSDVFVHFNSISGGIREAGIGTEVLYFAGHSTSSLLAINVATAISNASGLILRHGNGSLASNIGVLRLTTKPAILIEVCFVNSVTDVWIYRDKFKEICVAIAESTSGIKIKEDEKKMPQEEFNRMMGVYLTQALGDKPKDWFKKTTEIAKKAGVFKGDGSGNFNWELPVTREELAQVLCNLGLI